jgi:hypothetical protein
MVMDQEKAIGSVQTHNVVIPTLLGGNSATGVMKLNHQVLEVEAVVAVVVAIVSINLIFL